MVGGDSVRSEARTGVLARECGRLVSDGAVIRTAPLGQIDKRPRLRRVGGHGARTGRLNRVCVTTEHGTIGIRWASRDALLDRLADIDAAKGIRDAFVVVGASRPLRFSRTDAALLVSAIDDWAGRGGPQRLPHDVWGLRNALAADVRDA